MNVDWNGNTNTVVVTNPGNTGNTTANVTLTLSKTVYALGETITVKYSGVTEQLIAAKAWIGMAGHLNAASEHLNQDDYVRHESGTITMKAPNTAGTYQVRFFKAQGATAENYVAALSQTFTVVSQSSSGNADVYELCDGMNFDAYDLLTDTPTGSITMSGSNVTIDLKAFEYSDSDREASFGGVKLKGTITGTKNVQTSAGTCKCYEVKIDGGFSYELHDQYTGAFDGYVTFNNSSGKTYEDSCRAQIYEFADGHKECKIVLYGDMSISVQYPDDSAPVQRTDKGVHTFILAQNGERRYI